MSKLPTPKEMLDEPSGLSSLSKYGNASVAPTTGSAARTQQAPIAAIPQPGTTKAPVKEQAVQPEPKGTLAEVWPPTEPVLDTSETSVIQPPELPGLDPAAQRVVREAVNTARKAQEIEVAMARANVLRDILGMNGLDINITETWGSGEQPTTGREGV